MFLHQWQYPTIPYYHHLDKWRQFTRQCSLIFENLPEKNNITIESEEPLYINSTINDDYIRFNGAYPLSSNMFVIGNTVSYAVSNITGRVINRLNIQTNILEYWFICDTHGKPYDLVVKAVLLLYPLYFPEVIIEYDKKYNNEIIEWLFTFINKKEIIKLLI